jgi:hypothetical protein
MEASVLREAVGRLVRLRDAPDLNREAFGRQALGAIRELGVTWNDLLGPFAPDGIMLDMKLNGFITGPTLDEFVVCQLGLRHLHRLSAFELFCIALYRFGALARGLAEISDLSERLVAMHQEYLAQQALASRDLATATRAAQGANGIRLTSGSSLAFQAGLVHAVQQKPGETQYDAIMRSIAETEPPKLTEDQRRAAFVNAVMRPAL